MSEVFTYHQDPGHGWIEVSHAQLRDVYLTEFNFSPFSFYQKRFVPELDSFKTFYFLEEDCDAATFVQAYEAKHGRKPKVESKYTDHSWIPTLRRLP